MEAKLIKPKSNSLEDLQEYISECSSVVRDKIPKSASKLWERLLKESEGDKASRLFELIPCRLSMSCHDLTNAPKDIEQFFGFTKNGIYYTNMRELLNFGYSVQDLLPYVNFEKFHTFKCEAPYFLYGQVSTHCQITSVSHSQRYADCDRGYWKPEEVELSNEEWMSLVETTSPYELKNFMKEQGVKRKEVFDRGADMLQNRVFVLGGYMSNDNALPHFFRQRLDSHTQKETREFVQQMKDLVDE